MRKGRAHRAVHNRSSAGGATAPREARPDDRLRREPEVQNIRISCISGFRARRFAAPRPDRGGFFNNLLGLYCRPRAVAVTVERPAASWMAPARSLAMQP